jgi:hypothetical protein
MGNEIHVDLILINKMTYKKPATPEITNKDKVLAQIIHMITVATIRTMLLEMAKVKLISR